MANYANLEAAIQAAIYENNTNDITGAALHTVLLQMVSDMGKSGMLCNGVCDGNTVPPVAPDSNIFYIAPTGTYANFGGLTVADGEWAIFIYNGGWQKQSIPVVTADAVPTTGSTNPVQSGGVADALDTKADIDGYYSTLTAGSAENLIGRGTVPAEYTRRTSGGSADIGSGAAAIEKIHGNTLAWNQFLTNGDFSNAGAGWTVSGVSATYSDGVATLTAASATIKSIYRALINAVAGHKYLCVYNLKADAAMYVGCGYGGSFVYNAWNVTTSWGKYAKILTASSTDQYLYVYGVWTDTSVKLYAKELQIFDLTLMFGSGNEPTASEFEAFFPLNYYTLNTGSLLSLTGTGIETNGFNQWDEEWENGEINTSTGQNTGSTYVRSKNYIPAFGNTTYCLTKLSTWSNVRIFEYDAEKNFLRVWYEGYGNPTTILHTTLANTAYIRFYTWPDTTYLNDICINLSWSGYRNGEYEAYWDSTLALPITTVTSGGSAVFADGMKGAGTAYDELTSTKAVKRIEKVDLGSLSWTLSGTVFISSDLVGTIEEPAASSSMPNAICSKYGTSNYVNLADKTFTVIFATSTAHGRIYIQDSAYSDAPTFTTAMNGVYMYYALATPTEYTLDSEVNLNYRVDDFGTETLLPQNNATPTTAPIIYDVRYAMNAVDTLRNLPKNYISKDSMEHILNAMVTAGVISAYTLTWNATNENYDCTITA